MGGKQADRKLAKKAAKEVDQQDDNVATEAGDFKDLAKVLALDSCLAQVAPKLPDIVKEAKAIIEGKAPLKKTEDEKKADDAPTETEGEVPPPDAAEAAKPVAPEGPAEIFTTLCGRLVWHNGLGLGLPQTEGESKEAWLSMKELEIDFGPRSKNNAKGSPALDRIKASMYQNLPQYLHVLLALMMIRAFLFRSFFAFLPWMFGYQCLSLLLPLDGIEQLPQIPLEKVPVAARVAATMGIHALVWLFFLFELLWKTHFLEKFLLVGLVTYHAYATRPVQA
jgi:hypothetical protein